MGYITIEDERKQKERKYFESFTGQTKTVICRAPKKLERLLNSFENNNSVHYLSDGYFSLHDLVVSIVKKYAPVNVYFTTYALRELPCRQLVMCKLDGLIKELHALLDYKASVRSAEVNAFAKQNFTSLVLKPIHAKVCVIQNQKFNCSIVGSSNFTVNPKIEAGTISLEKTVADFHKDWIIKMMNDEKLF